MAICGVPLMGLPLMFSEVLISTGTPVRSVKRWRTLGEERILFRGDGLHTGGAVGVHNSGDRWRASAVTGDATAMYGLGWVSWKYLAALSAGTTGAKGRNGSRNFTAAIQPRRNIRQQR